MTTFRTLEQSLQEIIEAAKNYDTYKPLRPLLRSFIEDSSKMHTPPKNPDSQFWSSEPPREVIERFRALYDQYSKIYEQQHRKKPFSPFD